MQDFDDDEVIGYYINLLKAISMKFTRTTVQFFFDTSDTGQADTFSLYSESIKFIRHRDGMVSLPPPIRLQCFTPMPCRSCSPMLCSCRTLRFWVRLCNSC